MRRRRPTLLDVDPDTLESIRCAAVRRLRKKGCSCPNPVDLKNGGTFLVTHEGICELSNQDFKNLAG